MAASLCLKPAVRSCVCPVAASEPVATAKSSVAVFRSSKPASSQSLAKSACSAHNEKARAISVAAAEVSTSASVEKATTYHFVVANAKFMLDEEEHFQEQLKERLRWLGEKDKPQDFWLLYEPTFLDQFPEVTAKLQRPAVALVSTDSIWMTFMKLRLDRVLKGEFECDSQKTALDCKPIDFKIERPSPDWNAPYDKYEPGWWTPYLPQ